MKRVFFLVLSILLCSIQVFPQDRFGVVIRCGGQADFASVANCGSTFGVAGLGVLHVGIVDFSLGVGYSYKLCSRDKSMVTDVWLHEETFHYFHRMHFLNIPFVVSVRCWQQGKFRLMVNNELEYNRLCKHVEYLGDDRQTIAVEKWGDIPHEAVNGLTYRLGLTASYNISEHCVLNLSPFFGVKAMLNQYEPYPSHSPHDFNDNNPIYDHRFSSGVIIGMVYCF